MIFNEAIQTFLKDVIKQEQASLETYNPLKIEGQYAVIASQERVRFAKHLLSPEFAEYMTGKKDEQ